MSNHASRRALAALQLAVTAAAVAWLSTKVDLGTLLSAVGDLDPTYAMLAVAAWVLAFATGVVRWRWLMQGCGARELPPWGWTTRWYLIGLFYNTYAPGGVGGDVVRGVGARAWFGEGPSAATRSVGVTLIERVLGLSGLMVVVSTTMTLWPVADATALRPWTLLGMAVGLSSVAALLGVRRLAPHLPSWARARLEMLPELREPRLVGLALLASLATHTLIAMSGWFLLRGAGAAVGVLDSIVFVPLSVATTYIPISVGGLGVREAAFTSLFASVGVAADQAIVGSLGIYAIQLGVAGVGGLLQWWQPRGEEPADPHGG